MYKKKVNRIEDRIVSFHRPYVQPIKRGKQPPYVVMDMKYGHRLNAEGGGPKRLMLRIAGLRKNRGSETVLKGASVTAKNITASRESGIP